MSAPSIVATPARRRPSLGVVWREARILVGEHRGRLALGGALMLVSRLAGLVLPASLKPLFDEVIGKGRHGLLVPLVVASGIATVVQALSGFALSQVLGVAAQRAIADMRRRVQAHVLRLPVRWFDATQSGQVIARVMNDAEGIRNLVGTGIAQLAGSVVTAAFALSYLFWLNWRLTAVVLVVLAAFGVGMAWAFKRLRPLFRERGKLQADVTGRLGETLGGIRVIKAYAAEPRERAAFTAGIDRLFDNVRRSMTGVSAATAASTVVIAVVGVAMMLIGAQAVIAGTMTTGELITYSLFTGLLAAPVMQIASIGTQISEAFAGLDRLREVFAAVPEDADDANRAPCPVVRGDIAFEQVWFAYERAPDPAPQATADRRHAAAGAPPKPSLPGRPALHDVSFTAAAGSTVALVGPSGSGKSTLVGLIMAFNRPQRGRVLVDGVDLAGLRLAEWRRHLGVVLQDNVLFDGTVADNIAFSRPGAAREEIIAAGRLAHCQEFVDGFPEGWDTVVGERGVKLSGGQRQRIAIARALLADPRVLILDEATASLDSESEAAIQAGLTRLRAGRTTVVIAHRLSTIRTADQILVLDAGAIVERGTHAELFAAGGLYRRLHDRQHQVEAERHVNPGEELVAPAAVAPAAARQ